MWYSKFTFFDKKEGLKNEIPDVFFTLPTTDEEFKFISEYADGKPKEDFPLPANLKLPLEFIELLKYSNGGGIINSEREFGYFDLEAIREMYMNYGFLIWAPAFLPIAFNCGGKFYAYDIRQPDKFPIILVPAGNIGYEEDCWVFLGDTLEEVLSKTTNVEDELDILYPKFEPTENQKKLTELYTQLSQIKEDKNSGKINLKDFLSIKKQVEEQIKILEATN